MTRNLGVLERRLRGAIGILLVALALLVELPGYWELVPFVAGVALLRTAMLRYCPVKAFLGARRRSAIGRRPL